MIKVDYFIKIFEIVTDNVNYLKNIVQFCLKKSFFYHQNFWKYTIFKRLNDFIKNLGNKEA